MPQSKPEKGNKFTSIFWGVILLGVVLFFAVKLTGAMADKQRYDQLPPEVRHELDKASQPIELPVTPPTPPQTLPAGRMEDIDFNAYSQELAGAFGLEIGETRLDSIDKIRLYFSPEPGTNMVNMTSSTFERDDGSVMLFARNNIPDDAIFSEEIYAVFSGSKANKFNQKLAAYGLRQKCRRGDKANEWTTELCP